LPKNVNRALVAVAVAAAVVMVVVAAVVAAAVAAAAAVVAAIAIAATAGDPSGQLTKRLRDARLCASRLAPSTWLSRADPVTTSH
jgi:hypothetical protein